ncbi:hypothetical protein ACTFIU_003907 [Dictyostelium citrinum]
MNNNSNQQSFKIYEFIDRSKNMVKLSLNNYDEICNNFKWYIPTYFNIGIEVCDIHILDNAKKNKIAIRHIYDVENNLYRNFTFQELFYKSNQFGKKLKKLDLKQGDIIGCLLPQGFECALSHITIFRSGMISLPLSSLFGPDALEYRLSNSRASCIITDIEGIERILMIENGKLPTLKNIIILKNNYSNLKEEDIIKNDSYSIEIVDIDCINENADEYIPIKTKSSDPAIHLYTSGTTGNPKCCVHSHQVLIGSLSGVQFSFINLEKKEEVNYYSPAEWSWIVGLLVVLLPSLFYGITITSYKMKSKFEPSIALRLIQQFNINTTFLSPSTLKLLEIHCDSLNETSSLLSSSKIRMKSINTGGESLNEKLVEWIKDEFDVDVCEGYGQSEATFIIGNSPSIFPIKIGSMGKPLPGVNVQIIDSTTGEILSNNIVGEIAIELPSPMIFSHYLNDAISTKKKKILNEKWLITGDLGRKDNDGYIWYICRNDDIIKSNGFRIGPYEIENTLLKHPLVSNCGVIGVPDELRGQIVKAFIVLKPNEIETIKKMDILKKELQDFVKNTLSAFYPREIEFINELPMTINGKIIRNDLKLLHENKLK